MPPQQGSETVLVVDDEIAVLSLTQSMLARYGYTAITAQSAHEAMHLFEVWPDLEVDIAVIDLVMPNVGGIELAESLLEKRPGLPIIYISAYSEEAVLRPVHTRHLPFLAKPFTSLKLIGKIREMLDGAPRKTE
jgi:two-component system, cell cycle sensor histidine kinase and response regulator CckA